MRRPRPSSLMIVSTRVWTPFEEFELEFEEVLPAWAADRPSSVRTMRLTAHVFTTMPAVNRFEGQTREDNIAMRKTFVRAGFVKEAHYREGWPIENSPPLASVGYSILRRDWQTGRTTPVVWNDLRL